jgi:hypothetical protein
VFGRLYFLALDLRLLITPLVSTKISYLHINFFTFAKSFFFHILNYRVDQSIFCFFQIVHKRLAARNILLDFLLEPKITGFGPDPASVEDNDSTSVSHDISIILVDLTNRFHTAMVLCPPSVTSYGMVFL